MTTRKYTSRSQQSTLTSAVTSGATIIPIASATTLLGGATVSAGQTFTVVIDPDTALEEIVDVTAVSGNNLTVTRAVDMSGAAAQDHSAGAIIRHMIIGRDLRESNLHIEATGAYNDGTGTHAMHGLGATDGVVVGTDATQTLTNKTLTTPTIASFTNATHNHTNAAGGGTLTAGAIYYGFNSNTGNYTLALTDQGKILPFNTSSTGTITVPLNSSVAFPTGSFVNFIQTGTGPILMTGASGVTIQSESSKLKLKGQYAVAGVVKTDTDTWVAFGNLTS